MNRPITTTDIETVIKKFPKKKSNSSVEFYQAFREELTLILLKHFQKLQKEHSQAHSMRPPSP